MEMKYRIFSKNWEKSILFAFISIRKNCSFISTDEILLNRKTTLNGLESLTLKTCMPKLWDLIIQSTPLNRVTTVRGHFAPLNGEPY